MWTSRLAIVLALYFLLQPFRAMSASVEWNKFWYQDGEYASSMTVGPNGGRSFISWWNDYDTAGNLIWSVDPAPYMEISCAWMLVRPGDFIDEMFVKSRDGYFYKWGIFGEDDLRADYDIVFSANEDIWLGVAVTQNISTPNEVLFGWVQFHQDGDCHVSMVASALNLEGAGIRVGIGPIPEPSCMLLALIGCAFLSLRRGDRHCRSMSKGFSG